MPKPTKKNQETGWLESLPPEQRAYVDSEVARHGFADRRAPWWSLIRLAFSSVAHTAMVQAQDVLGLPSSARMNTPGRASGNWRWRMRPGALTPEMAGRLRDLAKLFER